MKADATKRFFMLAELVDGSGPDLVHMPLHSSVIDMGFPRIRGLILGEELWFFQVYPQTTICRHYSLSLMIHFSLGSPQPPKSFSRFPPWKASDLGCVALWLDSNCSTVPLPNCK